ncbi:MAG: hypothetical protein FJZ96_12030 [Chloroflexi bacterium]|nr:hypothetical protein [Chloroflexota bacterium]
MDRLVIPQLNRLIRHTSLKRGAVFGLILLAALLAFEVFNFSTTEFALTDLLGRDLRFAGIPWATILSIAFCGIDFAGIARLFTPEHGRDEPAEVWYLFAAWLLAALMNASLTWWGVAVAVRDHQALGSSILGRQNLVTVGPVFVAVMVWLIRVLIIGTFSLAGERLFSMAETRKQASNRQELFQTPTLDQSRVVRRQPPPGRSAPKPEPSYHPVGMSARPGERDRIVRR